MTKAALEMLDLRDNINLVLELSPHSWHHDISENCLVAPFGAVITPRNLNDDPDYEAR